jgi:hypothetical protein
MNMYVSANQSRGKWIVVIQMPLDDSFETSKMIPWVFTAKL